MNNVLRSLPSRFQVIVCFVLSLVLAALSNVHFLVTFLGFSQESLYLTSNLSAFRAQAFNNIDRFSLAPATSLIIFWALAGIVTLCIVKATRNGLLTVSYDLQVSKKFWHPSNFSQKDFWLAAISNLLLELASVMVILSSLWVLLFLALPFAALTIKVFAAHPLSLLNATYLVSGIISVWFICVLALWGVNLFVRTKPRTNFDD